MLIIILVATFFGGIWAGRKFWPKIEIVCEYNQPLVLGYELEIPPGYTIIKTTGGWRWATKTGYTSPYNEHPTKLLTIQDARRFNQTVH